MKILICSIIRNQEKNLPKWFNLISQLICSCRDIDYALSVYENDSIDGTKKWLNGISKVKNVRVLSENIGTEQYGSVWNIDRLKNLASARNKCLEGIDLDQFDKIAYIEPDVIYNPEWCKELFLAEHPKQAGFIPDIYSGWSLRSESNPKESMYLYDTCATRATKNDTSWRFENENDWIKNNLIQTRISHIDSNCLFNIYSTFNCFCVYNAEPFKRGLKWNYINTRINPSYIKIENGYLDADTSVICEDFRKTEFNRIVLNKNCIIRHI